MRRAQKPKAAAARDAAPPTPRTPTPFETRVYSLCSAIPRGRVATYGSMSAALGCGSARAVGQALRRNPFAPRVPCHRVIAASRGIGGFSGESSPSGAGGHLRRKRRMLVDEGCVFESEDEAGGGAAYWRVRAACVLSARETAALLLLPPNGGGK
jgi:methylated-DNA-[protein]-cysteine S-methyltransferase